MPVAYFDASALVKLLLAEPESRVADQLFEVSEVVATSRLAYPEVRSALAAAHRNHVIDDADLLAAESAWDDLWPQLWKIDLTPSVERSAGDLVRPHALSGADAVHVASALGIVPDPPVVVVWDRRFHAACRALGLPVVPNELP